MNKRGRGQGNEGAGIKKIPAAFAVGIFCTQRSALGSGCNSGFGSLNQLDEARFVVDGDFGQHFPV